MDTTASGISKKSQDAADSFLNVDVQVIGDTVKESQNIFMDKVHDWGKDFYNLLPNFLVAILLFIAIVFLANLVRRSVILWADRRSDANLGDVFGTFVKWGVIVWGALVCLTIVVPSMKSTDVLATLGVGSVALGFALKDILQNWFAGMLLLLKRPFNQGDMVTLKGYEGVIEKIETRSTLIRTYDGKRVIVPNADVYASTVMVHSAFMHIRGEHDIQIAHTTDFAKARQIIQDIIGSMTVIEKAPAPEIYIQDISPAAIVIRIRWWIDHRRANIPHVRSDLLNRIKTAFDQAHIEFAAPPAPLQA